MTDLQLDRVYRAATLLLIVITLAVLWAAK